MKALLLAATMLAAGIGYANATLVSTVTATGLGTGCNASDGGTGILNANCSGGIFTNVAVSASSPPLLNPPDLTATTLSVTTAAHTGTEVLDILINSSGFAFAGGPVTALFTVNNLIGAGTGPYELDISAPGAGTLSHTFNGSGSAQDGPTVLVPFTSDQAHFSLTFLAGGIESVDATIEIVGVTVPEPAGIALLGMGLLGLGMIRNRSHYITGA